MSEPLTTWGAWPEDGGVEFRVWAPTAEWVDVVIEGSGRTVPLDRQDDGTFAAWSGDVGIGDRYRFRVDGEGPWPDPASRFQPEGVHGPSEVIDPTRFPWNDGAWPGPDRADLVIYELHVGTFTPEGTFEAAASRLDDLAELGVTAVQLLPVNAVPGRWNWGYDGVALYAPARSYGGPDDLRRLVDRAHVLGMAVLLDVVYNHFGPDGNYTGVFSPFYVDPQQMTNWGPAINLGGEGSAFVRDFFIENARMWVRDYHVDGFRLDATHAFVDTGPRPFLQEFSEAVRSFQPSRPLVLIAEDHRNLDLILKPPAEGGWGFDGVWADDFHHELRRFLTGDSDGVFQDFRGMTADLATILDRGWLFTGEWSAYREKNRGTDPAGIPFRRFVFCTQNHDRVGNRGRGDRLSHAVDPATYRAATALLLLAPQTPMLFMGQEWAASTPFFYFTDHKPELGQAIRDGRAREFRKYADFADPARLAAVPDPQAESTFLAGKLDWSERTSPVHAASLQLHQSLLALRRSDPALRDGSHQALALDDATLALRLGIGTDAELVAVIRLRGSGAVLLDRSWIDAGRGPAIILSTEDTPFATDPTPIRLDDGTRPTLHFDRPGAVVFRKLPGIGA